MQVINSEYLANFKVLYYQKDINGDKNKNIYTFDEVHPYNNRLPTIHITGPVVNIPKLFGKKKIKNVKKKKWK